MTFWQFFKSQFAFFRWLLTVLTLAATIINLGNGSFHLPFPSIGQNFWLFYRSITHQIVSALYFYPLKFLHFHFVLPDWYKDLTVLSIASSAISKRTYEAMYAIKPEEAEAISTANIDPVGLAGYIGYYCSWPVDKFAFAIGWVVLKLSGKIVLARATYDTLWIVIRGMLFLGLLIPFEAIASADASSGRGDKVEEGDRLFLIWYLISVFAAICISIVLYFLPELI